MKTRRSVALALVFGALLVASAAVPHPPGSTLPLVAELFRTADRCLACHSGVTNAAGEDVSIGYDWRASMMANSARDPYWQAAVRREVIDHPAEAAAIQDECAKCHMPMARASAAAEGALASVFPHLGSADGDESALAMDGVSCALCHQIQEEGLGSEASFSGGFRVDTGDTTERSVFGPFDTDDGRVRVMHSATGFRPTRAEHLSTSELCASCHTLSTHALGAGGGARLPEQMPYLEWRASAFAGEGRSCQSCHMPEVEREVAVSSVLGQPREDVSRHTFLGGNFFMLGMLARYRSELGVKALPQELENAAARTVAQLQSETARVEIANGELREGRLLFDVAVTNLTGHKLPTGYPSRRVWLNVAVRDAAGRLLFESGAFAPDGSVAGNDADSDPLRFEPHHALIERPDQVQVYESVMADPAGRPTTGLLTAVAFVKDNRLLPRGFDRTRAGVDASVRGEAAQDGDFAGGGERVRYSVAVAGGAGPYDIDVRLWFQPIAFRWARNLAGYDAPETARFVSWYGAMSEASALVLARSGARVGGGF